MEWAEAFERGNRKVDTTLVGKTRVSTVFLGLDHNHDLFGPPLLFETMVFGGPMDQHQVRYGSYEEAQLGHAAVVSEVVSMQQPWPMFKFRCRQLWNKTKRFLRDYW